MSWPRPPALGSAVLALLAGLMACTQAMAASDRVLLVSATILPRIACERPAEPDARGLAPAPAGAMPGNAAPLCRSTDPSVTYRVRSESSGSAAVLVVEP